MKFTNQNTNDNFLNDYNETVKQAVENRFNLKSVTGGKQAECPCGQKRGNDCKFYYKQDKGTYKCFSENSCQLEKREGNFHDLNKVYKVIEKEEVVETIKPKKQFSATN